jgi:nucleoside phosphorylase
MNIVGLRRGSVIRHPGSAATGDGMAAKSARSKRPDPTIGLVTAIPEEYVAMRGLIDDPVDRYVADDPARYTMGTMPSADGRPPHRVALTTLGATATDAAANGCANLARSFPSISVVIMVGIAAGVPAVSHPERHVRLGDIVVAEGVIDYDHIRVLTDGAELRRGFPLPSAVLTRCTTILKSDELSGQRPWEEWLDISARSGLHSYSRPSDSTDVVYDAGGRKLDHPRRDRSGHHKGRPKVHYGLVGSADRALSDVAVRDQLAAQYRILALEMEGAGLGSSGFLNDLAWFMVRGISDYGDSRRDRVWRRYASLAAAAYVRALLATCLPLARVDNVRTLRRSR